MNQEHSSAYRARTIAIPAGRLSLEGDLSLPAKTGGVVIFAHGSGSSRHSPRNRYVAQVLQQAGLGTVLFDLLTREEEEVDEQTAELRFDIGLLARRLQQVTEWLLRQPQMTDLRIGYFGASTGAAAALVAAGELPQRLGAVVSRGGRPDLAAAALAKVRAPTLLIVGGADPVVIDLNRQALQQLRCEKRLEVVPEATHLFEEPGTLEQVARLAREWFRRHLASKDENRAA
jgi:putative phosphoribosyl transferase